MTCLLSDRWSSQRASVSSGPGTFGVGGDRAEGRRRAAPLAPPRPPRAGQGHRSRLDAAAAAAPERLDLGLAEEPGDRLVEEARPADRDLVAAVRGDEEPRPRDLAGEAPGVVDRDEWVTVADRDQRRGVDPMQIGGLEQGLDGDIGGDRGQEPLPGARALASVVAARELGRPRRVGREDPRRVHEPTSHARARFARRPRSR